MASLLSQAGERTRGVQGKLVSRSIDLMPQTRSGDKNWCQTGTYNSGIETYLRDFQTKTWKPLCMCKQLILLSHPVRSQAPCYRLVNSGSKRTRDLSRVLWVTGFLNWELRYVPRRGELCLKANWHPTLGNHCEYSELHFPDEGDICKMICQHDCTWAGC